MGFLRIGFSLENTEILSILVISHFGLIITMNDRVAALLELLWPLEQASGADRDTDSRQ